MRLQSLLLALGALAASTTLACGGDAANPSPTVEPAATTTPSATPDGSAELVAGKSIRSADGTLSIRATGGSPLKVLISKMSTVPAAPAGWTISGTAFDITARANEREVTKLEAEIELAFKAPAGQAVVMYHDGKSWVIVESNRAADGTLTAMTGHLTPYAVAMPKAGSSLKQAEGYAPPSVPQPAFTPGAGSSRTPLAATTPISRPTEIPARTPVSGGDSSVTPGATLTAIAGSSNVTPGATLTALAGSSNVTPGATLTAIAAGTPLATPTILAGSEEEAKDSLEAAATKYKGRKVLVTSASSYTAQLYNLATATMYYGLYGGVNEVITAGPIDSSSFEGTYAFLSEPKTAMPASSTAAQEQLIAIFPGAAGVQYRAVQESPTAYVYTYYDAFSRRVIGFSMVNGVPVAFMAVATDSFYWLVEELVEGL